MCLALPLGGDLSYTFGPPETATEKINDALEQLENLGVIASVSLLQIQGKVSGRECCGPANTKGKELAGSVTGDFGGFSVKAKIWPPGPIPTFDEDIDAFGFASLSLKAQFVGGIFLNLSGEVAGQIGYKKKECSKNSADQAGCFYGKLETGLTLGLSAEIGANASLTFDCIFCDTRTVAVAGSLLVGDLSWPITIAGIQFNEASCSAGLTGGVFNYGEGAFNMTARFSGGYETITGSRKFEASVNFLSCSISRGGVICNSWGGGSW